MLFSLIAIPYYLSPWIIPIWMQFFTCPKWASITPILFLAYLIFAVGNTVFVAIYYLEIPFFEQYKVTNQPWPWKTRSRKAFFRKVGMTLKMLAFNNFVVAPTAVALGVLFYNYELGTTLEDLPSFPMHVLQIGFMMVCEDFMFYWSHRLLHQPYFYKKIHYMHHMYKENVSFCSEFAHPIEFFMGDMVPLMLGSLILQKRTHFVTMSVFTVLRIIETMESHCGYEFPWGITRFIPLSCSTDYHDHHHRVNKGNFATFFIVWDTVFGTNQTYYKGL